MHITSLKLDHFRNHIQNEVEWVPGVNLITGPNGAGKTNLIDAIHYLCMSRSFVLSTDIYVASHGNTSFSVSGHFKGSIRKEFTVGCSYSRGEGKSITVNDSPLDKLSDLIGMVPVVVLSPQDRVLTGEGPAERRSFLDAFISQLSPGYLRDLIDYRKIMRQRNRLLSQMGESLSHNRQMLEAWDHQMVEAGVRIIQKRAQILQQFAHYLEEEFAIIAGIKHKPSFFYKTLCDDPTDPELVKKSYHMQLDEVFAKECERGVSLAGPHRDDVVFYLDDFELRKYGSQGQHRLFAFSLKLAQLRFYSEELDDLPIFLLDDVFGDLDPSKTKILMKMLTEHSGQSFITAANAALVLPYLTKEHGYYHLEVDSGQVNPVKQV